MSSLGMIMLGFGAIAAAREGTQDEVDSEAGIEGLLTRRKGPNTAPEGWATDPAASGDEAAMYCKDPATDCEGRAADVETDCEGPARTDVTSIETIYTLKRQPIGNDGKVVNGPEF